MILRFDFGAHRSLISLPVLNFHQTGIICKYKIPACGWCKRLSWYAQSLGVASLKKKRKPILRHRKIIGEAIRLRRKKINFTPEQLAELVNLNPKYLGEIERGEKIISIEALLRISKAVKTPARDFFRGI